MQDVVLRDARYAFQNLTFFEPRTVNPYDKHWSRKKKFELPPGIMTYRRAYSILKAHSMEDEKGMVKEMMPYFNVWLTYGTTLPEHLQQKKIDPYKIRTSHH